MADTNTGTVHTLSRITTGPALSSDATKLPDVPSNPTCWLQFQHPYYRANRARWQYALDCYTGDVLESSKIETYLIRRAAGESVDAYNERKKLADYTNHFAEVVESIAGMLFAVEGDANRVFVNENDKGLGSIDDPNTPIGKLWRAATTEGEGYLTVFKQLAILLEVTDFAWQMIDTAGPGQPIIKNLSPLVVPNWWEGPDGPELVVLEEVDSRQSMNDLPVRTIQYVHITTKGWQRYTIDESGQPMKVGEEGRHEYYDAHMRPMLPLYPVALPMKRPVGYQLARKAIAIFNKESERDNLLRIANTPRLVVPAPDEQFDTIMGRIAEGSNALQEDPQAGTAGGTRFIAPGTESAKIAGEVIREKIADFKANAHKAYDDGTGVQKTATEVRQDVGSGTGAFLQLLKAALDDAENNALMRIEQVVEPNRRDYWGIARVERSDDFMPADPAEVLDRSAALAWGKDKPVPMGISALKSLAMEIAKSRGATIDEDELTAAVEVRAILDTMETASFAGITLPAIVRALILEKLLAANGIVDADAVIEDGEGNKTKLLDLIRQQATALMQAADDAKLREGQNAFGDPNAGGGNTGNGGGGAPGNAGTQPPAE